MLKIKLDYYLLNIKAFFIRILFLLLKFAFSAWTFIIEFFVNIEAIIISLILSHKLIEDPPYARKKTGVKNEDI